MVLGVALGLMSKPMLVTLPFVLLLLDYWPLERFKTHRSNGGRQTLRLVLEKIPLIALSAVSSVVTFLVNEEQLVGLSSCQCRHEQVTPWSSMLFTSGKCSGRKARCFLPPPENRLPVLEISVALIVVVGITAAAFVFRKKAPYLITGWLWYLGMLVPVIGLMQVGWQGHADRYTYLPQIGLYIAVTWAVTDFTRSWRFQRMAMGVAALIVIGALSWRCWLQTSYWRDSETLFTHALAVTSNNDVALNNLGIIFLEKGQLDAAISKLEAAIDLRPENGPAHDNLAKAFLKKGRVAEAMVHYRKLVEINPENVETRNTVGTALIQQGHVKEAIDQWQDVLAIQPENGNAASNLAWVFATCPEDSIRDGAHAVELGERAFVSQVVRLQ